MSTAPTPTIVTTEEFERFIALPENDERLFELIDGQIEEKMPTEQHSYIQALITTLLNAYVMSKKLGRVTTEARHRPTGDTTNDRMPDIAFTRRSRLEPLVKQGPVDKLPDLCVEIKSPSDSYLEMRDKAQFYLKNGASLVWLVFPDKKVVEVHVADEPIRTLTDSDTLDGGDLLPGFTVTVHAIFEDVSLSE